MTASGSTFATKKGCCSVLKQSHFVEAQIHTLIRTVARHYDVSCCFASLHARDGIYLKARLGVDVKFLSLAGREKAIGYHFIDADRPIIIPDVSLVEWCKDDPLVLGPPFAGFYVGARLVMPDRTSVGSLCIIDKAPRPSISLQDCAMLEESAAKLVQLLTQEFGEEHSQWTSNTLGSLPIISDTQGSLPTIPDVQGCLLEGYHECAGPPSDDDLPTWLQDMEASGRAKSNGSLPSLSAACMPEEKLVGVVRKVAEHYKVRCCFIALHSSEELRVTARLGLERRSLPSSDRCIGHHFVDRDVPMIVLDTLATEWCKEDPLVVSPPYARFYVGAPLMMPGPTCVGTLCILDNTARDSFTLQEGLMLEESASLIVQLMKAKFGADLARWRSCTLGSVPQISDTLASLPELDSSQDFASFRRTSSPIDPGD
eukprot:TRINITY_DN77543_c0_g1_i1.p1 TRINITY_DN77543_c0_g1~~TRINITY_DN77543_c0_g1_i1.p1  ORF type:complete len:428 (+),score=51.46 TRINITY_DN77543_c0_g1_i1:26-1309(+)